MVKLSARCMSKTCRVPYIDEETKEKRCRGTPREFESDPKDWKVILSKINKLPKNSLTASGTCPECGGKISCIVSGKKSEKKSEEVVESLTK